ncbi:phosphoenolpyruvate--protein phosphotransferase [Plasticicumulans lactativorans]|uniref:Phosphoenolpyruvate-protein phosphotransferase n=1 Tax=Plasticicumulans lactativorans TaxID=1133106 RepID=A0A4R2L121_9GAMM|nr:phosphoenolpyruvate--protein phosphotransferase [Plasticicumulans lactativorans]TCO80134.1 phosphoenolpyruvate--protein phosphotransferase [Plasticicumulans lactativorans]
MPACLHGIGVSRGCAIGNTYHLVRNQPEVTEYAIPPKLIDDEVTRFEAALAQARQQLRDIRERVAHGVPAEVTSFIDAHLLMLDDPTLVDAPIRTIQLQGCNAEWALKLQRDLVVQVFEEMDDPYLRARKDDVDHVVRRVQGILLADEPNVDMMASRLEGRVIVADDLTPADTLVMQHQGVAAFVTEYGGPLSHTAILARNLGIPAVVGVRHARRLLAEDEPIIVDGQFGVVLAELDDGVLAHYRRRQKDEQRSRHELVKLKRQSAVTRDAVSIGLHANIELPEDAPAAKEVAVDGVGLYRTEFLFMNRPDVPDEEEHLASYLHVINTLGERPITIRTADLGADKQVDGGRRGPVATNPALGLRGIRLCLKDQDLFRPQLRAILRASHFGQVRMMIPMLSTTHEVAQVLRLVDETKRELRARGQAFDEHLPVGGMIEVPAAAVCAGQFARQLDFFSIGTNDLIQYSLAIDRIDDEVNYLYDPLHPAVLQLISMVIRAGRKAGIPVTLCGEMAGDPRYTRLLLGLGLAHFSMHPNSVLEVKRMVLDADAARLAEQVDRILRTAQPERQAQLLADLTGT